jgi:hypothetical protein
MKIREIILEAPKQMPKVDVKTRPIDILSQTFPDKVNRAKSIAAKSWNGFKSTKVFGLFGIEKWLAPLAIWIDDMSAINEMWEAGYFNSYGNKAGEAAQQMRTAHTQLAFSRLATNYLAWFAAAKATGAAVRAIVFLIPGLGWLAGTASLVAQAALFALLQSDAAQKFITLKIIENIPYLDTAFYESARVVGAGGVAFPALITQIRKKFTGAAADAVADKTPQSVKSAAGAAKGAVDRVAPKTTEPLGAMSDLAKDL